MKIDGTVLEAVEGKIIFNTLKKAAPVEAAACRKSSTASAVKGA